MSKQSKIQALANAITSLITSHDADSSAHATLFDNKQNKRSTIVAYSSDSETLDLNNLIDTDKGYRISNYSLSKLLNSPFTNGMVPICFVVSEQLSKNKYYQTIYEVHDNAESKKIYIRVRYTSNTWTSWITVADESIINNRIDELEAGIINIINGVDNDE